MGWGRGWAGAEKARQAAQAQQAVVVQGCCWQLVALREQALMLYQLVAMLWWSGLCWPVSLPVLARCLGSRLHAQDQLAASLWVQAEGGQRLGWQQGWGPRRYLWRQAQRLLEQFLQHQLRLMLQELARCPGVRVQQQQAQSVRAEQAVTVRQQSRLAEVGLHDLQVLQQLVSLKVQVVWSQQVKQRAQLRLWVLQLVPKQQQAGQGLQLTAGQQV